MPLKEFPSGVVSNELTGLALYYYLDVLCLSSLVYNSGVMNSLGTVVASLDVSFLSVCYLLSLHSVKLFICLAKPRNGEYSLLKCFSSGPRSSHSSPRESAPPPLSSSFIMSPSTSNSLGYHLLCYEMLTVQGDDALHSAVRLLPVVFTLVFGVVA